MKMQSVQLPNGKYEAHVMTFDLDDDGRIELNSDHIANAINRLNGLDMSWDRYEDIIDNLIEADKRYGEVMAE